MRDSRMARIGLALALITFLLTGWSAAKGLLSFAEVVPLASLGYLPLYMKLSLAKFLLQLVVSVAGVALAVQGRLKARFRWVWMGVCLLLAICVTEWAVLHFVARRMDSPGEIVYDIRHAIFAAWHVCTLIALTPRTYFQGRIAS